MGIRFEVKCILLFVWFSSLFVVPLLIFVKGLLLHRDVLPHRSFCKNDSFAACSAATADVRSCLHLYDGASDDGQYCVPSDYKVVLLVIDALRFDFVEYRPSDERDPAPYHNKLKTIADLLATKSEHSRLFRFVADPPTTTMQRINGLTTGSLPTFIDIGSNFASSEIDEDNIIDNMIRAGKRAVFLGDDTWTKLYPARFVRSFPFDSFNVWDLDTVDRGIEKHLLSEIRRTDWHLIVAHFLGVDHCGHRYGPNHVEMERKLLEMDFVIRDVVNEIRTRDDVILFVMGDHGMTATGDHGGGTESEVSSALFAYSPVHPFFDDARRSSQSVSQVDIVPTLASILGVAVPFSNTGRIVLDCVPKNVLRSVATAAFVLWQNIEQITNYVNRYSLRNTQFDSARKDQILSTYSNLKNRWYRVDSTNVFREFVAEYDSYMKSILDMCRQVWIRFDFSLICCGITLMVVAAVLNVIVANETTTKMLLNSMDIVFYSSGIFLISWLLLPLHVASIVFQAVSVVFLGRWCYRRSLVGLWNRKMVRVPFVLSHVCLAAALFSNSFILEEPSTVLFFVETCLWFTYLWNGRNIVGGSFIVASIVYRIGFFTVRCRDDQQVCDETLLENHFNTKYPFVAAVAFLLTTNVHAPANRFLTFVSRTCVSLLFVFWLKESILGGVFSSYTFVDCIPGLVLAVCVVALGLLVYDPVLDAEVVDNSARARLASSNLSLIMCVASATLLDSSVSVSSVSMVVCLQYAGAFLASIAFTTNSNEEIEWSPLVLWSMSAIYWFYATGHYASFSAIQWKAAFLFQKNIGSSTLLPGTLVTMNTFASYIVHGLLVMILLSRGKCSLRNKNAYLLRSMVAYLKYVTIFATRLLAMMMACALHSRHLMMWRIFAPKFIFEAVAFLTTIISSLIGLLVAYNIYR